MTTERTLELTAYLVIRPKDDALDKGIIIRNKEETAETASSFIVRSILLEMNPGEVGSLIMSSRRLTDDMSNQLEVLEMNDLEGEEHDQSS